jgi:hypothetical protein
MFLRPPLGPSVRVRYQRATREQAGNGSSRPAVARSTQRLLQLSASVGSILIASVKSAMARSLSPLACHAVPRLL